MVYDGAGKESFLRAWNCSFSKEQLVDLHTFVKKLPVLDASESSVFDAGADCWATEPAQGEDQEDPSQPRKGRGHGEAPRPGRGLLRRRGRGDVAHREVLGRTADHDGPRWIGNVADFSATLPMVRSAHEHDLRDLGRGAQSHGRAGKSQAVAHKERALTVAILAAHVVERELHHRARVDLPAVRVSR